MIRIEDQHRELLRAANAFSNQHGHAALQAILRATVGVDRIVDVAPEDYATALVALLDGKMKAAATRRKPRSLDTAAIWDRWNSARGAS